MTIEVNQSMIEAMEETASIGIDMLDIWQGKAVNNIIYAIGAALARSVEQGIFDRSVADEIKLIMDGELGEVSDEDFADHLGAMSPN